jgi:guanylate kinase
MRVGQLFVVSAPSGAGKTSLVNALVKGVPGLAVSVSHTTRVPRAGEVDGVDYNFVTRAEFEALIAGRRMLEHATVFGNLYGTSREWVDERLRNGTDVILEIDWQGARQVRERRPVSVSIFILPPSLAELRARLERRGQDRSEVIEQRLAEAIEELSHYGEYDYLVVNDDFDRAVQDLASIVRSRRLGLMTQRENLRELLERLVRE